MKTRLGMVLSAFALMMCSGCVLMKSDEEWNEVMYKVRKAEKGLSGGFRLTSIE
ncbi:MAG: hypothetical protein FWH21_07100 [Kiritimatiellaeota bacterium]|nr:hypothetical protein [Kiritimatiellota bacterium]